MSQRVSPPSPTFTETEWLELMIFRYKNYNMPKNRGKSTNSSVLDTFSFFAVSDVYLSSRPPLAVQIIQPASYEVSDAAETGVSGCAPHSVHDPSYTGTSVFPSRWRPWKGRSVRILFYPFFKGQLLKCRNISVEYQLHGLDTKPKACNQSLSHIISALFFFEMVPVITIWDMNICIFECLVTSKQRE